jgi:hypothetical protein
MATEADFVIARGLCRTTKDVKIDTYAKGMARIRSRSGSTTSLYAETVAEARRDAKLFFEATREPTRCTTCWMRRFRRSRRRLSRVGRDHARPHERSVGCYVAHHMYGKYKYREIAHLFDFTWIPRYGTNDGKQQTQPAYPCDLWQFTSVGKIAGISGGRI